MEPEETKVEGTPTEEAETAAPVAPATEEPKTPEEAPAA